MNSGEKFLRTALLPMRSSLSPLSMPCAGQSRFEPELRTQFAAHLARAQVAGQKNDGLLEIHQRAVAQTQGRFVQNSQQQTHQRLRRLLDLVEKQNREIAGFARRPAQLLLREQRLSFPMSQIPGRRSQQFRHFMFHLIFAAIHFQQLLRTAVQHIRQRFHGLGLSRSGRPQQQKNARRTPFRSQPGPVHFHVRNNRCNCGRLADQSSRQRLRDIARPIAIGMGRATDLECNA